jgi:hypothetical protein
MDEPAGPARVPSSIICPRRRAPQWEDGIERALARLGDPADVLKRHGVWFRGREARCPFHEDREPSFSLFRGRDGRELWRCHVCDIAGNAIHLEARLSGRSLGAVIRDG